ncbi:MAG TPA: Co2+/Mg2+ efflux protein ApaG [Roseiflexaceae bacterium]|nr:Co2+/Mg2+ efflux protein ApaG [Roseiflexaceae bacterium]HMP40926.1 Co2+/Mg2+ efflux protein ApaG [Roseiflexaceae bacterium]
MKRPFYYRETIGIRVTVRPMYLPDHSQPERDHYVFAYFIRIENAGRRTVQLLSRHWFIHDSIGEDNEVVGDGVVGEQPILAPGDVHEYQSFCILKSGSGYMEGSYRFIAHDDTLFDAYIPRFELQAGDPPVRSA